MYLVYIDFSTHNSGGGITISHIYFIYGMAYEALMNIKRILPITLMAIGVVIFTYFIINLVDPPWGASQIDNRSTSQLAVSIGAMLFVIGICLRKYFK